jgi:hypothetical protein
MKIHPDASDSVIKKYLGLKGNFTRIRLLEALDYTQSFCVKKEIPSDFSTDPANLFHLGPSVLYRLCKDNNIKTHIDTTVENMEYYLKLHGKDFEFLENLLMKNITDKSQIIHLLSVLDVVKTPNDIFSHSVVKNISNVHKPTNNNEAIWFCAKKYDLDISDSPEPYKEYKALVNGKFPLYMPLYKINPDIYNLLKNFNHKLPENVYNTLPDLYKRFSSEETYESLVLKVKEPCFYHGIFPYLENHRTPIHLDDIKTINLTEAISYGIQNMSITVYKKDELIELFEKNKNLNDPYNKPFKNIHTLKIICIENNFNILYNLITILNTPLNIECLDIPQLKEIFELGMLMRQTPDDIDVYTRIQALNESINDLNQELKKCLYNLPLLKYNLGEFQIAGSAYDRHTLMERIHLVTEGESTNNMASCMRTSSNFIAASAYYYLSKLGKVPDYKIEDLDWLA